MDYKVEPKDYESTYKFGSSPLAEALWVCSLDSSQDDQAGTVDDIGWHALFHFEQDEDVKLFDEHPDSMEKAPVVTVPKGSYILMENDQGFVYVDSYPFKGAEVEEDWADISKRYGDWLDDEGGVYSGL